MITLQSGVCLLWVFIFPDHIRIGFIGRLTKKRGLTYCRLIVQLRNAGYNIQAFAAGDCFDDNDDFRVMLRSANIVIWGALIPNIS